MHPYFVPVVGDGGAGECEQQHIHRIHHVLAHPGRYTTLVMVAELKVVNKPAFSPQNVDKYLAHKVTGGWLVDSQAFFASLH